MDWSLALIPVLVSIGLVYFSLYQALSYLLRRHLIWFLAMVIILAPYAYVLVQVSNPLDLMWILALTPFYGVLVMLIVATTTIVRFYCSAFAVLALMEFLLRRRKSLIYAHKDNRSFDPLWQKRFSARSSEVKKKTRLERPLRKIGAILSKGVSNYWTVAISILLVAIVASTLVSGNLLKNPTYDEAIQFIESDKTNSHSYIAGKYVCDNFAKDFQINAKKSSLSCGYVTVIFADMTRHALNCFNTTDKGVIYVEPQTDEIVALNVGERYSAFSISLQNNELTVVGFYADW